MYYMPNPLNFVTSNNYVLASQAFKPAECISGSKEKTDLGHHMFLLGDWDWTYQ